MSGIIKPNCIFPTAHYQFCGYLQNRAYWKTSIKQLAIQDTLPIKLAAVFGSLSLQNIINGRDWLGPPANIKGTNKDAKIYVEGPRPCTIFCFTLIQYAWLRNQHLSIG